MFRITSIITPGGIRLAGRGEIADWIAANPGRPIIQIVRRSGWMASGVSGQMMVGN